jgi:hypothetical protein
VQLGICLIMLDRLEPLSSMQPQELAYGWVRGLPFSRLQIFENACQVVASRPGGMAGFFTNSRRGGAVSQTLHADLRGNAVGALGWLRNR